MEPNFHHGDFVIVNKLAYHIGEPKKGDITICWLNSGNRRENIIKRVIGVPGDEIDMQIREQGWDWEYILYINGEEQKEEYIAEAMQQAGTIDYPFIVEENCYFVMGDNRNASTDSREVTVGAISKENIKGKVVFRLYPFDNIGAIKQTKER
jgi:signal peptidase I